jgi:hypothetical protein
MDYGSVIMPFTAITTAPPAITNVDPPPGALGRDQAITFRLTDDLEEYVLKELWVRFGDVPSYDLAHDGTSFLGEYAPLSTRSAVPHGWDFSLRRVGGWPAGMTVRLRATVVDSEGNMVVIDA